jgi:DNA-directed DNA polymerase III PolC
MTKPTRFVGLHSHSTYSTFDAIGRPQDHIEFVIKNGGDALALTDHGNMNGFSHQYVHSEKLKKAGKPFKAIHGVEAYFVPSLSRWRELYDAQKAAGSLAPKKGKAKEEDASPEPLEPGNEMAGTQLELAEVSEIKKAEAETADADDSGGTIVENEQESKGTASKYRNPLYQRNHLVLLAKNDAGLKSLFRIVSNSAADGFYRYPRVDLDMLREHGNGNIIALTACIAGYPAKIVFDHQKEPDHTLWMPNSDNYEEIQKELALAIAEFQEALGKENYYLEIQFNKLGAQHLVNQHLIEASKRTGCPLVVTCDAHYSDPTHWREREIYKMMGMLQFLKPEDGRKPIPQSIDELKCELYPKNAEQVWDSYKAYCKDFDFYQDDVVREAIERTHDIAHQQIGSVQPDRRVKLPAIERIVEKDELKRITEELGPETDEDMIAFKEVKKLAIEGLKFRRVSHKQNYIDRLKYELEVIKTLKFAKYFLTYYQIMRVVGEHMLIGNARGSAGGSLLAYVLNITQMDPIKHDLLFERFMTRKKKAFPDIDSDFGDREKAVKLLQEFFGEENVIPVSNFATLKPLSLIKDLSKLYNISFEDVNKYTVTMIPEVMAVKKAEPGFDAAQYELTFEDLAEHSPSYKAFMKNVAEKIPGFQDTLDVLWKQQRNIGRHAGGVIITQASRDAMPLIKAKGGLQTPWPEGLAARHLEDFGLLKFDILGLGTLRMFEECIRRILKKEGKKYPTQKDINQWFFEKLHPDNNPLNDQRVFKHVYWESRYAGVFQFVKDNVQKFMQQMKPTSVLDIAIATSIYRPGPMGLGAHNLFLKNRQNPEEVNYVHPVLEEVLGYTSGLLIFQEQLQLIVNRLSGMHLDDTDSIRKAFTKKDASNKDKQAKEIKALGDKFVEDSMKHSGISEEAAREVWADFEKWTAYGFNKSHAMAYAITSYQCAWFLTYYPDEWIASYLDFATVGKGKSASGEDPKSVALMEARSLGYKVGKPDINLSEDDFTMRPGKILVPSFSAIKGVGKAALLEIKTHRPYTKLEDLIVNPDGSWRHSKFNKRAFANLIKTGAFESMGLVGPGKPFSNYKQVHTVFIDNYDKMKKISARKKNNDAVAEMNLLIREVTTNQPDDWTTEEKIEHSKELTGQIDMSLVVSPEMFDYFTKAKIESIDSYDSEGQFYWGIVDSCVVDTSSTGKQYLRLTFHGDSGAKRTCKVWNYDGDNDVLFKKHDIIVGKFKKDQWGMKTFPNQLRLLTRKEGMK